MSISTGSDGSSKHEYIIIDGIKIYHRLSKDVIQFKSEFSSEWSNASYDAENFELIDAAHEYINQSLLASE